MCTPSRLAADAARPAWVWALVISEPTSAANAAPAIRKDAPVRQAREMIFMGSSKGKGARIGIRAPSLDQLPVFVQRTDARVARSFAASGPVVGVEFMSLSGLITEPLNVSPA